MAMIEINEKTRILELLEQEPHLEKYLVSLSDKFKLLKNPIMRKTVGRLATIQDAAGMSGIAVADLIVQLENQIRAHDPAAELAEAQVAKQRRELLKGIIRDLHNGTEVEEAKRRFETLAKEIDAAEIAQLEQGLIADGMQEGEIKRLCDVHVQVFQESLDKKDALSVPEGHPVHTFMRENRIAEKICGKIEELLNAIGDLPTLLLFEERKKELMTVLTDLSQIDLHYLRKENQLFSMLERHGITGPSRVMWAIHDDIRKQYKQAIAMTVENNAIQAVSLSRVSIRAIRDMIYKEENILFPMSLETLSEEDWEKVRRGEEEIGFAWFGAAPTWGSVATESQPQTAGKLPVDTGLLTLEQIKLIFTHLPVDISFVNEEDEVVFYSANAERIFPRSPGVIGRKVQNCHPSSSVHVVNQILGEFKSGAKEVAEFWIQMRGKFLHIRYFAVRDQDKAYKGCLEVSQDVTGIRNLEGQRRLLEW